MIARMMQRSSFWNPPASSDRIPVIASILLFFFSPFFHLLAEDSPKASVWKISDADSTIYLAGSIHMLREKDWPIPAVFDAVYERVNEIIFELDMAEMMKPGAAEQLRQLGALPEGESLSDHLGKETMEKLHRFLSDLGLSTSLLDRYTPGMTLLMLSSLEAAKYGATPERGLENIYFAKSVSDGKPSKGLETLEDQISIFNGLDAATLEKKIGTSLDQMEEGESKLEAIIQFWRLGKSEALAKALSEDESLSDLHESLLIRRNQKWIPAIEKALAESHDVMILVGAAHLVGPDSVIALLKKKGHRVTQLANEE